MNTGKTARLSRFAGKPFLRRRRRDFPVQTAWGRRAFSLITALPKPRALKTGAVLSNKIGGPWTDGPSGGKGVGFFFFILAFYGRALYAAPAAPLPPSSVTACHSSYLSDFDRRLSRLTETVEERFRAGRLSGIYFIQKTNIAKAEGPYNPVWTPPTREGDVFLNPSYYGKLMELLRPVFRFHRTGVIVVDSLVHAYKLKKTVLQIFPEGEFSIYNKMIAYQHKTLKEKSNGGGFHYIFVTAGDVGGVDLSHTAAYIRLDRIREGNRIQEIQDFLDSYTGAGMSSILFLAAHYPARGGNGRSWGDLITALSKTSVNTELNNRPAQKQMGLDQALSHLRAWNFPDRQTFNEWYGSFLRSKHFPASLKSYSEGLNGYPVTWKQKRETQPSADRINPTSPVLEREGESSSSAGRTSPDSPFLERGKEDSPSAGRANPISQALDRGGDSPPAGRRETSQVLGRERETAPSAGRTDPSSATRLQDTPSSALSARLPRSFKFRYKGLSEEEKTQIGWLIEGVTGLVFTSAEKTVLKLRLFTESSKKTADTLGEELNMSRSAVHKMEDSLISLFQTSPLVPPALKDRIRSLSKKSHSLFGYDEFSKREQDQIDGWVAVAKGRIKWNKRDREIMDGYLFTSHPETLVRLGRRFNIHPNSVGSRAKQILTHLRDSPAVPRELRDIISSRLPYKEKIRFKYSDFSEDQRERMEGWVALVKERIQLTDRELYLMDHYIFTDKRETQKQIGAKFGIDHTAVFQHIQRLLRNLRDNPAVPEGLRNLIRIGSEPRERYFRFRYSELSREERDQIDEWIALVKERIDLNETEKYILERHIFTRTPEALKDIGRRWGMAPHDMTLLKNKLLRKIQGSGAVPVGLKAVLPNPA